jgi:DNA alkylation repair enzyme
MPSVQLERLRPQINAIITQYENSDMFTRSLISLLKSYGGDIDRSPSQISAYSLIPRLNVPQVVLNQLEISLKHLARTYPSQTKSIVEKLWEQQYFEPKKIALILLSNLHTQEKDFYFEKINIWVDADIEGPIIDVILENAIKNKDIYASKQWLALIEKWLYSKISRLRKIGLTAIADLMDAETYHNLPAIFHLIEPMLSKPHVSINKDLTTLIHSLIRASQPETAAFLIHLSIMYPKPEVYALIRKCLSFFDQYYSSEVSKRLAIY